MDALVDVLGWFNADRTTAAIAGVALIGIFYSARSASAAKKQARSAKDQAERASEQVALSKQQVDLMLRQVSQAEAVEAAAQQARREALQPNVLVDIAPGANDPGVFVLSISNIGASIARNVRIKALDEMVRSDGLKLHELTVFTEPISVMPPGRRVSSSTMLASSRSRATHRCGAASGLTAKAPSAQSKPPIMT